MLSFGSCNDWLDVRPDTEQKEEDQFSSYKGFRDALTGCYMTLGNTNIYGEKLTMSNIESLASLWNMPDNSSSLSESRSSDFYLAEHDYKNDDAKEAMQSIWSGLYNVIVQANLIIKHADENKNVFADESTRSVIQGEAYAIRALCHLDILRLFGQLPEGGTQQVKLPYSKATAFNERPVFEDFDIYVSMLENDLNKADSLLKNNDPVFSYTFDELKSLNNKDLEDEYMLNRQSRLNYWAVKALQARMYLYLGNKEKSYASAMAVINGEGADGGPVLPLSGHSDIVENGYKACPNECLFYLSKYDVKTVAGILIGGADIEAGSNYLYITKSRLDELFQGQSTDSHNRYRYLWNQSVVEKNTGVKCAAITKYYFADNAESKTFYYQIIPMLRMSEVYLIAIETTTNLSEANELYAAYMLDRDVLLNGDAFSSLDEVQGVVLDEYRREFFAEGQMFYTYKRLNSGYMLWYEKEMTEDDYILWNCLGAGFNA